LPQSELPEALESMIVMRDLLAQENLRALNIHAKDGEVKLAIRDALRAIWNSPAYVLRRTLDELRPSRMVKNGVSPTKFRSNQDRLWPGQHVSSLQGAVLPRDDWS
jgi:hypothetical protein